MITYGAVLQRYRSIAVIATLLVGIYTSSIGAQEIDHCPELLSNESNLDKVYGMSRMVFIASISPRGGANKKIYNYQLIDPELKGLVPASGYLTFAEECSPVTEEAIYLFFLDSMQEKIADANAVFFSLTMEGPGYSWIAEWIQHKLRERFPEETDD